MTSEWDKTNVRSVNRADSWEKFSRWIGSLDSPVRIFRGVSSEDYDLTPKIGRPETRGLGYVQQNEKWILDEFRRGARAYIREGIEPKDWWEWLALAQHHGLPTRLLDWTYSPLVAAYFAVEKEGDNGDALIYSFTPAKTKTATDLSPFHCANVMRFDPPHLSPRIAAQSACFTNHIDPTKALAENKGLKRLIIAKDFCADLKRRLNNLGINRATLFPELDGLSGHLTWWNQNIGNYDEYPLGEMGPPSGAKKTD